MRDYRFGEVEIIAKDIITNWDEAVNRGTPDGICRMSSDNMENAGIVFVVYFDLDARRIEIYLQDVKEGADLYCITTMDNTQRSVAYALDSILSYAKDVILCNILDAKEMNR